MPFGLGVPELLIIFLIVAIVFGPAQLPKMGRALGDTIREFRNIGKELDDGK
jgi:sec-independent protein translocase protein TatA